MAQGIDFGPRGLTMSAMYCTVCTKLVQPLVRFRWYALFGMMLIYGLWLFVVRYQATRCPMCRNSGTPLKSV